MIPRISFLTVTALLSSVMSMPAAAENAGQEALSAVAACEKNVNAIGASMGHSEAKGDDGRRLYQFIVRTNGSDYAVLCDAETGVVTDIGPHRG